MSPISWKQHAVALLVLCLVGIAVHHKDIFLAGALTDEECYEGGFDAVSAGKSPYSAYCFLYPPAFASAGSWLVDTVGREPVRYGIRATNALALVALIWVSACCYFTSRRSERAHFADGSASSLRVLGPPLLLASVLMLAPGVRLGVFVGNLTFLIGALVLLAFSIVDKRSVLTGAIPAGVLIAVSLLIKPLAAGCVLLLFAPAGIRRDLRGSFSAESSSLGSRSTGESPGTHLGLIARSLSGRRWLAGLIAVSLTALALLVQWDEFQRMLTLEMPNVARERSLSLSRLSRLLGLGEMRVTILGLVSLAMVWLTWGRLAERRDLLFAILVTIPLTTVIVWSHTRVLLFPVVAWSIAALFNRHRPGGSTWRWPEDSRMRLETVLVVGCGIVILFTHGSTLPNVSPLLKLLLFIPAMLTSILAPAILGYTWFSPRYLELRKTSRLGAQSERVDSALADTC